MLFYLQNDILTISWVNEAEREKIKEVKIKQGIQFLLTLTFVTHFCL